MISLKQFEESIAEAQVPAITQSEKITFAKIEQNALRDLALAMPQTDWANESALCMDAKRYLKSVTKSQTDVLKDAFDSIKTMSEERGFVLVNVKDILDEEGAAIARRSLDIILSLIGQPFGVFKKYGMWQTLGINEDAKLFRAESLGYIPFHIDFDQAELTPNHVVLFCERSDENGGGGNLLFDYKTYLSDLPGFVLDKINAVNLSYTTLFNTYGVGNVYNPHPLNDRHAGILRYNGKAFPELKSDEERALFIRLEKTFIENGSHIMLERGDLLVVDQRRYAHARLPLGNLNPDPSRDKSNDRSIWHCHVSGIPILKM